MATIYDVAKLAEVSHTAVSAVINDRPIRMKDATRQRILAAAKTLGYQTNRVAQQLSTGKFNTFALCFAGIGRYIFKSQTNNQLVAGIVDCASENGVSLLLAPTTCSLDVSIARLPSQGVDGAVIVGPVPLTGDVTSAIGNCTVPLVCIDAHPGLAYSNTVDADSHAGIKSGVDYLVSVGHKKMAYISPSPDYQCLVDRMRGFYQSVQDAGVSLADQTTHIVPLADVPAVVRQTVAATDGPTALVCAEETVTIAVLDEVTRLGLKIPDDLTILSYDDVPGHALSQSVNIVRNDFFWIGITAVDLLGKLISGECTAPMSLRLPPELLVRTR